jgi:hypothetical protein
MIILWINRAGWPASAPCHAERYLTNFWREQVPKKAETVRFLRWTLPPITHIITTCQKRSHRSSSMCGITGKIYLNPEKCVEPELVTKMCRTLSHRGPDEEGYFTKNNVGLGVRRLSIIDVDGGHQPICNETRTVWAVQNGGNLQFSRADPKTATNGAYVRNPLGY